MNKTQIAQRIRLLRKHLDLTQEEFAKQIGYDRSYIANIEREKAEVTKRLILLIEKTYNANPAWIEEGKGDMFNGPSIMDSVGSMDEERQQILPLNFRGVWFPGQEIKLHDKRDIVIIPVYNEVDAGDAVRNHASLDPIDWVPIKAKWLNQNMIAIKIKGNSMEPTITDGSVVMVDCNQKDIVDGKVYVIEVPYIGATVKRVYVEYQQITLKPDNPLHKEKAFPLETLEREDIRVIGRVVTVISKL